MSRTSTAAVLTDGPGEGVLALLVRFGAKDELVVSWQRGDGTEGTQQRNAGDT